MLSCIQRNVQSKIVSVALGILDSFDIGEILQAAGCFLACDEVLTRHNVDPLLTIRSLNASATHLQSRAHPILSERRFAKATRRVAPPYQGSQSRIPSGFPLLHRTAPGPAAPATNS